MSDSESESVEPVEVKAPEKKKRPPMTEQRRKLMLENLAKGRKTRAENLSNKRLEKEQEQVKKEQEHKCDHCGSQFKYKTSKNKHMKTCKENPDYKPEEEVEEKPVDTLPKENENVEMERKEKEEKPPPKEKGKKKKKIVYVSDDSSSDEEIVYKKKSKKRVVYVERPAPIPPPPVLQRQNAEAPAPSRPLITEAQKQAIIKKRAEEARYAQMGRMQEEKANKIKQLSANMLRKNRF